MNDSCQNLSANLDGNRIWTIVTRFHRKNDPIKKLDVNNDNIEAALQVR